MEGKRTFLKHNEHNAFTWILGVSSSQTQTKIQISALLLFSLCDPGQINVSELWFPHV